MSISEALTVIIKSMAVFSALLLLGTLIRAKVKVFQNLYIPACVIGGFIGLILGPEVLDLIPFGENIMSTASALPGIFIIPILTSVPFCANFGGNGLKGGGNKVKDVLFVALLLGAAPWFQFIIGLCTNLGCSSVGVATFPTLGLDMAMGFMGGHGLAASLGSMLKAAGDPNWEVAQGLATTAATVGLIGGIVIGVGLINYAAKKGYAAKVKPGSQMPLETRIGYYDRNAQRPSLGQQTTVASSVETLSLHLAIVLLASGGGYILQKAISKTGIVALSSMATWFYGMMIMFPLWWAIRKLRLDFLFDETVKNKINGMLSDYMIVAAIMSIPLKVVASYWIPLLIECVIGLILTPIVSWYICKKYINNDWFETCLGTIGSNTGVFVTGMLLIKMADPNYETEGASNYSLGYSVLSWLTTPLISFVVVLTFTEGIIKSLGINFVLLLAYSLVAVIFCGKPKTSKKTST